MYTPSRMFARACAGALALILPALALAGSWSLPANPTLNTGYNFQWYGSVASNNQVAMMEYQAPGTSTWMDCGAGFPGSNWQANVSGGGGFDRTGVWKFRIVQDLNSNVVVSDQTDLTVGNVPPHPPPSTPANLSASSIAMYAFTLNWTASTDNTGISRYDIYANGAKVATATGTSARISGLQAATTYQITVRAFDTAGLGSGLSGILPVTTATYVPPAYGWTLPTNPTVGSYANLTWVGSANESTVLLWARAPGSTTWITCGGGGGPFNPKTVSGGWTLNVSGNWLFEVRDGPFPTSTVLSQVTVTVR